MELTITIPTVPVGAWEWGEKVKQAAERLTRANRDLRAAQDRLSEQTRAVTLNEELTPDARQAEIARLREKATNDVQEAAGAARAALRRLQTLAAEGRERAAAADPQTALLDEMTRQRLWGRVKGQLDALTDGPTLQTRLMQIADRAAREKDQATLLTLREEIGPYLRARGMGGTAETRIRQLAAPYTPPLLLAAESLFDQITQAEAAIEAHSVMAHRAATGRATPADRLAYGYASGQARASA